MHARALDHLAPLALDSARVAFAESPRTVPCVPFEEPPRVRHRRLHERPADRAARGRGSRPHRQHHLRVFGPDRQSRASPACRARGGRCRRRQRGAGPRDLRDPRRTSKPLGAGLRGDHDAARRRRRDRDALLDATPGEFGRRPAPARARAGALDRQRLEPGPPRVHGRHPRRPRDRALPGRAGHGGHDLGGRGGRRERPRRRRRRPRDLRRAGLRVLPRQPPAQSRAVLPLDGRPPRLHRRRPAQQRGARVRRAPLDHSRRPDGLRHQPDVVERRGGRPFPAGPIRLFVDAGGRRARGLGLVSRRDPVALPPARRRTAGRAPEAGPRRPVITAPGRTTRRPTGTQRPPATRQERRDAARRDQRLASARTVPTQRPAWQSPMALTTAAAVVIGLVVIILASGVLSPKATVGTLLKPLQPAPVALIDPTNPRALGKADAPVTVETWSDFQCPACDAFATTIEPDLISQYVATGKARIVYRDRLIIDRAPTDTESHQAAAAARCVGDKFWAFHDYLFENQTRRVRTWAGSRLRSWPRSPMRWARIARPTTPAWRTGRRPWWPPRSPRMRSA